MIQQTSKRGFNIAVGCPACGGELELESDFLVTTCKHCGSILRISMPLIPPAYIVKSKLAPREVRFQVDRYLKSNGLPLTGSETEIKGFYYPYWKIDAVLLRVRNWVEKRYVSSEDGETETTFEERKVETTLSPYSITTAARAAIAGIPDNIGERPEYVKLLPFWEENVQTDFVAAEVQTTWSDALRSAIANIEILNHAAAADYGVNRSALFRPICSLVYFPYFLFQSQLDGRARDFTVDAITGRIIAQLDDYSGIIESLLSQSGAQEFGKLGVELHRCGNCGEGLPDNKSYAYICNNCGRLTMLEEHRALRKEIAEATFEATRNDRLFPFWSFQIPNQDAAEFRRGFGGINNSDRLVVPAFRIPNFEAMYRLCKRMSPAISKFGFSAVQSFDNRYVPANVGVTEALALARAALIRDEASRGVRGQIEIKEFASDDIALVYAPFHPESYFYVDSALGAVTFEKTLVDRT